MNSVHDMGGMHNMGPIAPEADEPVFHADWEARMYALASATRGWGKWNIDQSRHAREKMPPAEYLAASYYEIWLYGFVALLLENGLVTQAELAAGRALPGAPPVPADVRPVAADQVETIVAAGASTCVASEMPAKFRAGDAVTARRTNPTGHTRLPRYVRGRHGTIERDHGVYVFPDSNAHRRGRKPQHVYAVRFAARELWGPEAAAADSVLVDLWDDHLEPA